MPKHKVEEYTPKQLTKVKKDTLKHYLDNKGELSVKMLARYAKVTQTQVREWMRAEEWSSKLESSALDDLSLKTKEAILDAAEEFGLDGREEAFCYHYLKTFNATTAGIRAGYSSSSAHNKAYLLLKDPRIQKFIKHIKQVRNEELLLDSTRIVREYVKFAFADMTDFVKFGPGGVTIRPADQVDGQMITKIKEGRDGVTIELVDKKWAFDKLEQHIDMPIGWKQQLELDKVDILRQKLELDKLKANPGIVGEEEDDGFIAALRSSVKEVWADEKVGD